jgi:2-hydroxy-3-keto-5-methylthiopentenyl-1-phosphate phosphatase
MLFTKENVIELLSFMLEDNGVVSNHPAKAKKMSQEWLDTKIEMGNAHFINTNQVQQSLKETIKEIGENPKLLKTIKNIQNLIKD